MTRLDEIRQRIEAGGRGANPHEWIAVLEADIEWLLAELEKVRTQRDARRWTSGMELDKP